MSDKKRYGLIFLRTLAAFLAIWLLMAVILTVRNHESNLDTLELKLEQNIDMLADNIQIVLDGGAAEARKPVMIAGRLYSQTLFDGAGLVVYRVYDEQMNEVARTQITEGTFTMNGSGVYDHSILFDAVLTDEEQVELAELLKADNYRLDTFYGSLYLEWGEAPNMGLYGEVTGIFDESRNVVYPQRLVYYYEDHQTVLMESDHEMFEGAELTTLRFDSAQISSSINWGKNSPENMLKLYRQAQAMLDEHVDGRESSAGSLNFRYDGCIGRYHAESGVPIARACAYAPRKIITYGLGFTYISTLLVVLLAAIWVSRMQIVTLKKERQFTRAVAHELKTPAAVLRAYAEALREDVAPEQRQGYLASIEEESDRMAVLVNELLDLSRLDGAAGILDQQSLSLSGLVREGFERLRVPMKERGLELDLVLDPVAVRGDPRRLTQMVNNLAVNALRHALPGPITVCLRREGENVVLTTENPCQELTSEQLGRIWEPFYKVEEGRSGEGSGLGLAVVKNIVLLHGGRCRAERVPGGIRFVVELPG